MLPFGEGEVDSAARLEPERGAGVIGACRVEALDAERRLHVGVAGPPPLSWTASGTAELTAVLARLSAAAPALPGRPVRQSPSIADTSEPNASRGPVSRSSRSFDRSFASGLSRGVMETAGHGVDTAQLRLTASLCKLLILLEPASGLEPLTC